jgi:2OG-Fe(II) oxygenase superfamily
MVCRSTHTLADGARLEDANHKKSMDPSCLTAAALPEDGEVVVNNDSNNIFKQCHNHHKRNPNVPDRLDDLDVLLDFRTAVHTIAAQKPPPANNQESHGTTKFAPYIQRITANERILFSDAEQQQRERQPVTIFGLSCYPGFLFFPAALDETLQRQLAYQALTAYCEPPYRTNIELVAPKSSETVLLDSSDVAAGSMWDLWSQQTSAEDEEQNLETKHPHPQHMRYYRCFEKLSWATLGYFYDWTQRCYHEDDYSPFPSDLATLGRVFAQWSLSLEKDGETSYDPSACIVNYYGSVMIDKSALA